MTDISPLPENQAQLAEPPDVLCVGKRLQEARETRGLSIAEIAVSLKLGEKQVKALEADNWQALPGTTFIRGFVRNYARLLNLEAAPLMRMLDEKLDASKPSLDLPESTHVKMPEPAGQTQARDYLLPAVGLVLVMLAALIYILLPDDISALRGRISSLLELTPAHIETTEAKPAVEAVLPPGKTLNEVLAPQDPPSAAELPPPSSANDRMEPSVAAETLTPRPEALSPAPTQPSSAAPLRFSFTQDCWVEVRDRKGNILYSQNAGAGQEQEIAGQAPFSIAIGNIRGVKLMYRDQIVDLAPHARGEVARLTLE